MRALIAVVSLCAIALPGWAAEDAETAPLVTFRDVPGESSRRTLVDPRTIWVEYSSELDPASLRATLNGNDVSPWFMPTFWTSQQVELPFREGANTLVVTGLSSDGSRSETFTKHIEYGPIAPVLSDTSSRSLTPEEYEEIRKKSRRKP